jgi:DNA (cytosine-5)-methyltransferase 1
VRTHARPICVEVFAGAGGLALGFEQAGFDVAAAVEFDPIHAATHEFNFPNSRVICRDVTKISGREIREIAGLRNRDIDVLTGGPPCQGFSLIGHRVLEDPRNALVFHFLRLVRELRPKYCVMENVPGMVTGSHNMMFKELIRRLRRIGYAVDSFLLNAAFFGVPQNRTRVFIVAAREGQPLLQPPVFRSALRGADGTLREDPADHVPTFWALAARASKPVLCPSVEEAISDLPDIDSWDSLLLSDELECPLAPGSDYALRLRGDLLDPDDFSYQRERPEKVIAGCLRAVHTSLSRRRFSKTAAGTTEPISRFYKLSWQGVANTLRAGTASDHGAFTSPRPIHPQYPRCISVREAARLHSYPDWFWFHQTKWHGFRQIGNSVPPLLGRAVGQTIVAALGVQPTRPTGMLQFGRRELIRFNMAAAASHFNVDRGVIPQRKRSAKSEPSSGRRGGGPGRVAERRGKYRADSKRKRDSKAQRRPAQRRPAQGRRRAR